MPIQTPPRCNLLCEAVARRWFVAEATRLREATFIECIAYESDFFDRKGHFPFLSALQGSVRYAALHAFVARHRAQDSQRPDSGAAPFRTLRDWSARMPDSVRS